MTEQLNNRLTNTKNSMETWIVWFNTIAPNTELEIVIALHQTLECHLLLAGSWAQRVLQFALWLPDKLPHPPNLPKTRPTFAVPKTHQGLLLPASSALQTFLSLCCSLTFLSLLTCCKWTRGLIVNIGPGPLKVQILVKAYTKSKGGKYWYQKRCASVNIGKYWFNRIRGAPVAGSSNFRSSLPCLSLLLRFFAPLIQFLFAV